MWKTIYFRDWNAYSISSTKALWHTIISFTVLRTIQRILTCECRMISQPAFIQKQLQLFSGQAKCDLDDEQRRVILQIPSEFRFAIRLVPCIVSQSSL